MFYNNKNVVVTGGTGFIGTKIILELLKRGSHVTTHTNIRPMQIDDERITLVENIDLFDLDDCMNLLNGADYVVHCAGPVSHPSVIRSDMQILSKHVRIMVNVLEASIKCGVKRFLDINSSTRYPERNYPVTEEEYWDGHPHESYAGYGWMRRYRETILEFTTTFSDLKIGLSRATAVFGEYDNLNLETCHVVPALIKRFLTGEDPLVVWGSPDVVRDFLYVDDLVKGCLLVLEKGISMRPYNIGGGDKVTIGNIVDLIVKDRCKVVYDQTKPTTIPFRAVSSQRANEELGFVPDFTIEEGIDRTINWVNDQLATWIWRIKR